MADEFEQFRKRSYHGGNDPSMSCSESCGTLGRTAAPAVRGPPLKRSRSHPQGKTGRTRRALSTVSKPIITTTAPQEEEQTQLAQEERTQEEALLDRLTSSPSNKPRQNLLTPRAPMNSVLHSSLQSLVLLPKINEYMESRFSRHIPHHVRLFPNPTAAVPRRSSCGKRERRAVSPIHLTPSASSRSLSPRTPKLKHRTRSLQTSSDVPALRVHVLGQQGVGKATLVRTFTTADEPYMAVNDIEDYSEGASVSIVQNGKEDLMLITNDATSQIGDIDAKNNADAYIVVYALNDKHSFDAAVEAVKTIRASTACRSIPIVMVANKGDMVRSRVVKSKVGRDAAVKHRCKYVEVSALLNINVDELFFGVLTQLYFCRERFINKAASDSNMQCPARRRPILRAIGYLGKLFARYKEYENDIENLFTP